MAADYAKNIKTDYGAIGDGASSDNTAFTNFRAFARTQPGNGQLLIPPGNYVLTGAIPFDGIANLVISGYGATVPSLRFTGMGGVAPWQLLSARAQTVSQNATTLALVNPADINLAGTGNHTGTRFAVGRWAMLDALALMDYGYPPNHYDNQFVQITAIAGSTIAFDPPAKRRYKSTYPETSAPPYPYDTAGPATIHLLTNAGGSVDDASITAWDADVEVHGLTVNNTLGGGTAQIYSPGRRIVYKDVTFVGCAPIATLNQSFLAQNCTTDAVECENDKNCERVEYRDCALGSMSTQSASIDQLVLTGTRIAGYCLGTARHTALSGCTLNTLRFGPLGYGQSSDITLTNTTVVSFDAQLANRTAVSAFTNSGGHLTYNGSGIVIWAVPGPCFIGSSARTFGFPFNITDIREVAGKQVLVTDLPDPLPTLPAAFGASLDFISHPMPAVTATNFTGCPEALDLSTAPAGAPLFSHAKQVYTGNPAENRYINIWGKLRSSTYRIMVNVSQAYSGINPTCVFHAAGPSGAEILHPDRTWGQLDLTINAKVAGERIIYSDSIVGAQSGDGLSAPGEVSFIELVWPHFADDLSGESAAVRPIITFEILTDQNAMHNYGIIYATGSKMIRRIIADSNNLAGHVGPGESLLVMKQKATPNIFEAQDAVQSATGVKPASTRCAVIDQTGKVTGFVSADPVLDTIAGVKLVSSDTAQKDWSWSEKDGFKQPAAAIAAAP